MKLHTEEKLYKIMKLIVLTQVILELLSLENFVYYVYNILSFIFGLQIIWCFNSMFEDKLKFLYHTNTKVTEIV